MPTLTDFLAELPPAWRCGQIKVGKSGQPGPPSRDWLQKFWEQVLPNIGLCSPFLILFLQQSARITARRCYVTFTFTEIVSFGVQAAAHWQCSIPQELSGFALVPVIGGFASQQHCSSHSLVRERDARLIHGIQPSAVLKCLAAAGCLCAADSTSDSIQLTLPSGERRSAPASCERIVLALQALPRHQLLADLQSGSPAVSYPLGLRGLSAGFQAQSVGRQLREVLARAASRTSTAIPDF